MQDFLTLDKQLCFAIYETSSQFSKLYSAILEEFGLTYPQYLVLLALWEEDGIGVTALGERVRLGNGTLTPLLNRLEKNGWIRKVRSKEDERKVYVHLDQKAVSQKSAITQAVQETISTCNITLDEYAQLMDHLKRLSDKLQRTRLRS